MGNNEEMPEVLKVAIAAAYEILPGEDKMAYTKKIMKRCDFVCSMRDKLELAKEDAEEMREFISENKRHMVFQSKEESDAFEEKASRIMEKLDNKVKHFEKGVENAIMIADNETELEYLKIVSDLKKLGFPVDVVRLAYGLSSEQIERIATW